LIVSDKIREILLKEVQFNIKQAQEYLQNQVLRIFPDIISSAQTIKASYSLLDFIERFLPISFFLFS